MKKYLFLFVLLALASCTLDNLKGTMKNESAVINVAITLPENFVEYGLGGYTVEFRNTNFGFRYLKQTDNEGKVSQEIEYGTYTVIVRGEITTPGGKALVSGQVPIIFNADYNHSSPLTLNTSVNMLSPLILSEIYFTNSLWANGTTGYTKDKYFVVHNNTPEVQYMDGVGLGFHNSYNSNALNRYTKADGTPRDLIPHAWGFIVPGSGTDHPLLPGEDAIFALSAVNHTAISGAGPLFVNLARENVWAMYRSETPNATTMQDPPQAPANLAFGYFPGQGTAVTVSTSSPAVFIYKFQGLSATLNTYEKVAMDYVKDGATPGVDGSHVQFALPNLTSLPVINIPKEWVLDGVEIYRADPFYKRFPSTIETGRIMGPLQYSGISLIRKVNETLSAEYGFTVYQDTNNSEADWIEIPYPTLSRR